MDIHVDHKDRATPLPGHPAVPEIPLSRTQLAAVDFLVRCAEDMEPLAALTGAAGTGKTAALNVALSRRESAGDRVIRVNNFVAGPLSLHRVLAAALGIAEAGELSAEQLEPALRRSLADSGQANPPVVAVDGAQSLLPETLRYLSLLAGLREAGRPLFRILLVGRPGFTVRQPVPLQFTLDAMQAEDAREIIDHAFAAAGVVAVDEAVQDIVRHAQGNLRKLDILLRASIEGAQKSRLTPGGRKRITSQGVQTAAGARPPGRPARNRVPVAFLAVPALLGVVVVGAGIAYHERLPGSSDAVDRVPAAHRTAPARAGDTHLLPPVQPSQQARTTIPAPAAPQPSDAAPIVSPAPPTVARAPEPVISPAPTQAVPAPPPVTGVTEPPAAPSDPGEHHVRPLPAPPPAPSPRTVARASGHFRIYNIGACHHGVCPRWSVTDLDRQQRFVAAFDPAPLHLDQDTMQRIREGAIDLVVSGAVAGGGPDGRTLDASTLESMAPHHGRPRSPLSEPQDLGAPQPTQSPPPGFLSMPADGSPFGQPGSSPYQQGGQY